MEMEGEWSEKWRESAQMKNSGGKDGSEKLWSEKWREKR